MFIRLVHTLIWGIPGGSEGKASACDVGDPGSIPGSGRSPGERMATHSSILAWRIPGTEEPGGLQSTGSQRVGHDWATTHTHTHTHTHSYACVQCHFFYMVYHELSISITSSWRPSLVPSIFAKLLYHNFLISCVYLLLITSWFWFTFIFCEKNKNKKLYTLLS